MLTVKSDSSQISMLIYEMYHYPDAIVQKRFHVIYLKMTNPKLNCTQIGSYVALHRNTTTVNAQSFMEFLLYLRSQMLDKAIVIVLDNARYQHCNLVLHLINNRLLYTLQGFPPYVHLKGFAIV